MNIEIDQVRLEEKSVLRNLMELYAYDFSEYDDADVDVHGYYGYGYLDNYWTEEGRFPFLVKVDGKLAGVVLVRTIMEGEQSPVYSIAEFFVMKKYRKSGVGRQVAWRVFDLFPGRWSVNEIKENVPAQVFWRKVISEYTGGNYEEIWVDDENWQGPVQRFVSLGK